MNFLKPKFWGIKKSIFVFLLIPFSILFNLLLFIKKKFFVVKKFKIPIICVGNIYIGGTGKTPLAIKINNELKNLKKKSIIIKKYYKRHEDEHKLIQEKTGSLILNKNRSKAIMEAEKKDYDVVILDDGFQDHSIQKNLNIICFNSNQLDGNGWVLPAGPLRENLNSIKDAQIMIINGDKNDEFEQKVLRISKNIKIYYSKYSPTNIEQFINKKIYAFAGIGNPENFFKLLSKYNLNIQKKITYPDHYNYNQKELGQIIDEAIKNKCEIITTEKDFFRIKDHGLNQIKFLKIKLEILEEKKFINEILNYL